MLDFLNQQGGLLPEPLAAHLFRQIVDAARCPSADTRTSSGIAESRVVSSMHDQLSGDGDGLQVLYMHTRGYCHRDLKPENCVIETASMTLKVRMGMPHANNCLLHWKCSIETNSAIVRVLLHDLLF